MKTALVFLLGTAIGIGVYVLFEWQPFDMVRNHAARCEERFTFTCGWGDFEHPWIFQASNDHAGRTFGKFFKDKATYDGFKRAFTEFARR